MVFLHGLGGTGRIWRPIASALEDQWDCIAPDQRGHGGSQLLPPGEQERFHAEDYARDVADLLQDLGVERAILVGHSMGVRTALALARSEPRRVQMLVAVDIGITSEWGGGMGAPLALFLKALPESFPDRTTLKEYLDRHCPDPAIAQYLSAVAQPMPSSAPSPAPSWRFPFRHSAVIQTIEEAHQAPLGQWLREILASGIRVWFLRGEQSRVWSKADFEREKKEFSHPLLHFEEWENCGHGLPFEQRPRFVDFLGNLPV